MKIVIISTYYSKGMGYVENCLPKALAKIGHEVHLVTSDYNVYGTSKDYENTYASFLGSAKQETGQFLNDGYTVHRLNSKIVFGYVKIKKLNNKIKKLNPDIVHSIEIASLQTFSIVKLKFRKHFKIFTESHQHMSIIKPYLKTNGSNILKRITYWLTRTLPTRIASSQIEKCYAIAPDCAEVANKFYGVPKRKIKIQPLGTDTDLFSVTNSESEIKIRKQLREKNNIPKDSIVCIYTGRFSASKNPLLLAESINYLSKQKMSIFGVFIGEGSQKNDILRSLNCIVIPFMKHIDLVDYYKMSDIAIWPYQESLSMLDAAACGLPLIVTNKMGDKERIEGNGDTYEEGNMISLANKIKNIIDNKKKLGETGRKKMVDNYSWDRIALNLEQDFIESINN